MNDRKFYLAMACYAVLAILAWRTLDREIRLATWVFLAGLAVKTYLATLRRDD